MGGKNDRSGAPDLGQDLATRLSAMELGQRRHTPTPSNLNPDGGRQLLGADKGVDAEDVPLYYNNFDGLPLPYAAPSGQKEHMMLKSAIRQAASQETKDSNGGVVRVDPITEGEVAYLKSMKDQAELAKFDDYVESFIDPRQPGNMKWLMEIYPDYVNRRLQQAHTDYEYALRNQMIDSWGINTFDDLHFKYLVDQGKLSGPHLANDVGAVGDTYAPGWLSPFNFQSPRKSDSILALPFNSARVGRRPDPANQWLLNRANRPLGAGTDEGSLARGMYGGEVQAAPSWPAVPTNWATGLFDRSRGSV